MSSIRGILDPITLKITSLPSVTEVENGWQEFTVDVGVAVISVTVRPRIWKNFIEATQQSTDWVAIVTGRMGELTDIGFVLNQPGIQVFENQAVEDA
jgi:hypothetical protein